LIVFSLFWHPLHTETVCEGSLFPYSISPNLPIHSLVHAEPLLLPLLYPQKFKF
jgi:hypothetical protein